MTLRVMLIDETPQRAALLEQALKDHGYEVVARVGPGEDLLARVEQLQPDIVIVDMESPDRDTLESMRNISRDRPRPIVMFSESGDRRTIDAAVRAGVSAYVVAGLDPNRLRPIVEVAVARFREFHALRDELEQTKSKLADRRDVDKAKGMLMTEKGMSEEQAYAALRKMAMDRNITIGEAARALIAAADLLR